MDCLIPPHGGKLVNRLVGEAAKGKILTEAKGLPRIPLNVQQQCDVEMIAIGAFSPLEGFMGSKDYASVCDCMQPGWLETALAHPDRLPSGCQDGRVRQGRPADQPDG